MKIEVDVNVRWAGMDEHIFKTLAHLTHLGESIMSAISDFAAKQAAFNDRMDAAVAGLQGDVAALNAEIAKLQSSAGAVTAEDQASLDAITARSQTIADKLDALDAMTPPVAPTA